MNIREAQALWQLLAYLDPYRVEAMARLLKVIPAADTDPVDTRAHVWQAVLDDVPLPDAIEAVIEWHRTHDGDDLILPGNIRQATGRA